MPNAEYLKTADSSTIVSAVNQYGSIALCHNGLTETENASIAAKAITDLFEENLKLDGFYTTSISKDDTYEKIEYGIKDINSALAFVRITKKIYYENLEFDPSGNVTDFDPSGNIKEEIGPLFPREFAKEFVDNLNKLLRSKLTRTKD